MNVISPFGFTLTADRKFNNSGNGIGYNLILIDAYHLVTAGKFPGIDIYNLIIINKSFCFRLV